MTICPTCGTDTEDGPCPLFCAGTIPSPVRVAYDRALADDSEDNRKALAAARRAEADRNS